MTTNEKKKKRKKNTRVTFTIEKVEKLEKNQARMVNINKVNRINIFQISEESYEFNKTVYGKTTVIKSTQEKEKQRESLCFERKVQIIRYTMLYAVVGVSVILHRRQ